MALFTDGPASTIEDLAAQDAQLPGTASSEGIDLTVKLGLAHEAIGIELREMVWRARRFELSHVVVTPPLRLWHTYRTLESVYRDAYNSQLNDRYAGKRDQFRELSNWAYDRLIRAGIGMTNRPVPRAATPELRPAAGALPDGAYYATMAWLNAAGEEGEPATPSVITVAGSSFLAQPSAAPAVATGWNVYAGAGPDTLARQNGAPIAPDTPWQITELATAGVAPGGGQAPSYFHAIPRVIQRG